MKTPSHKLSSNRIFIVLCILLFTNFYSIGQFRVVTKSFIENSWSCHWGYAAYEDYLLELYSDSTIEISIYSYSSKDNSSMNLVGYTGTYRVKHDTIEVVYRSIKGDIKFKTPTGKTFLRPSIAGPITLYPSPFFILKESSMVSPDHFFPPMKLSSATEANKLKYTFYVWDKQPNNTSKGLFAMTKI